MHGGRQTGDEAEDIFGQILFGFAVCVQTFFDMFDNRAADDHGVGKRGDGALRNPTPPFRDYLPRVGTCRRTTSPVRSTASQKV